MGNVSELTQITNPIHQTRGFHQRETYGFVSTESLLNTFAEHGWVPSTTQIGGVRNRDKRGFQKHLIRMQNEQLPLVHGLTGDNSSRVELVLINSHDGTSAMRLMWGLIRIACLNGVISGTAMRSVTLVHSKNIVARLHSGIEEMQQSLPAFVDQLNRLQGSKMQEDAVRHMVKTVYDARLAGVKNLVDVDYSLPRLLRYQDRAGDAFTVMNRIQEVLMRGGIKYTHTVDIKGAGGSVLRQALQYGRTRKVGSVPAQLKLNRMVYDAALTAIDAGVS